MSLKRFLVLFLMLFPLPILSVAQEIGVEGESQFRRQLDSFFWNYSTTFARETQNYAVFFSNNFNSRLNLFDGEVRNVQDEIRALLFFDSGLSSRFGITGEANAYRFSNTNVKQDYILGGLSYRPDEVITIKGLAGFMRDERNRLSDSGFMAGLRVDTEPFSAGDFLIRSSVYADYADISPRTYQTYRINTESQFDIENFAMLADLQLARNIRESYQASSFFNRETSDFTEAVQTDTTGFQVRALFPLFDVLEARLDMGFLNNNRTVTNNPLTDDIEQTLFDTRILRQSFNLRFQATLPYENSRFSLGLAYTVGGRDARLINTDDLSDDQARRRTEILQNSNFDQTRFELFTVNNIWIGTRNTTTVSGNISIMNYDTPAINKDDRDELFLQGRLSNEHRFSEFFRTRITLAGESVHTVYLFAERSIENNRRQSIRLLPEYTWDPFSWLQIRQQLLVRANYTVEDFEVPGRPKNDQVSREFAINTQADINVAREWWLELSGSRSELRIGRLLWDEFREIPTDTLITYNARAMVTHRSGGLITSVGMRYHLKLDFLPRATNVAEDVLEDGSVVQRTRSAPGQQRTFQWGPMVQMRLPLYSRNELLVNGWYQMQGIRQKLYTVYPEEFRDLFERAERNVRRRTFPNVEITARFRF